MQKGKEELISKGGSPSYRPPETTVAEEYRNPSLDGLGRCDGNTPIRRYPNGILDVPYVGGKVMEAIDKGRHGGIVMLNQLDKAMLSIMMPGSSIVDPAFGRILLKMTDQEIAQVRDWVSAKLHASAHWNAGQGSGMWPGDFADVNKSKGEGSRGGMVIGRTKSGKPIYASTNHESYGKFHSKDHRDAAEFHTKAAIAAKDQGNKKAWKMHATAAEAHSRSQWQKMSKGRKEEAPGEEHPERKLPPEEKKQAAEQMKKLKERMDDQEDDGSVSEEEFKSGKLPTAGSALGKSLQNLNRALLEKNGEPPFEKAGPKGPGSRGGKVIGYTQSGKAIYENSHHVGRHRGWSKQDHSDAANAHEKMWDKLDARLSPSAKNWSPQDHEDYERREAHSIPYSKKEARRWMHGAISEFHDRKASEFDPGFKGHREGDSPKDFRGDAERMRKEIPMLGNKGYKKEYRMR